MAKKIVKVNEEKIRGYMVGDIPDAIENEDIIVVEVPEEGNNERQDTEKESDIEKAHRYHIDMPSETMTAKRNN